jgi:hypothetical protein
LDCLAEYVVRLIHVGGGDVAEVVLSLVGVFLKRSINDFHQLMMLASEVSDCIEAFEKRVLLYLLDFFIYFLVASARLAL